MGVFVVGWRPALERYGFALFGTQVAGCWLSFAA